MHKKKKMGKPSKTIEAKRAELQAKESAIWEDLSKESHRIEKKVENNVKKIGVVAAGTIAGYLIFKAVSGGFSSNTPKNTTKPPRRNSLASKLFAQAINRLVPIAIEKLKSEFDNPISHDPESANREKETR